MARNSIIWELIPPYDQPASVLVGSMHSSSEAAFKHLHLIVDRMEKYDQVAFEINMLEGIVSQGDFVVQSGLTLAHFLTEPQKRKVKDLLETHFGFPYSLCLQLYPMFTISILTQLLLNEGNKEFLDEYLWKYALQKDKEIIGLEDVKEHYDVLRTIPMKVQVKAFKDFIFNLTKVRKEYRYLSSLYAKQEIHKIYKRSMGSLGRIKHKMLIDRNAIMVDQLTKYNFEKGALMAVVGAAHLSGHYGILHHLRKRDYEINPIYAERNLIYS